MGTPPIEHGPRSDQPVIVVPLDGSVLAERALPFGKAMARATGARLRLLRAVPPAAFGGRDPSPAHTAAVRVADAYLAAVMARAPADLAVETAVVTAEPAEAILAAATPPVGLLVLATHSRTPVGELLYGSVARAVLARCPIPLLLVRAWRAAPPPPLAPGATILAPLDGSPFAEAALPSAGRLARVIDGSLVLLRVVVPPERVWSGTFGLLLAAAEPELDEVVAAAYSYLDRVRDDLRRQASALPIATEVRVGGQATSIMHAAADHGAALVAMATHGQTGFGWVLLGSVAEDVLRHGAQPLLLIRPPALPAAEVTPAGSAAAGATGRASAPQEVGSEG